MKQKTLLIMLTIAFVNVHGAAVEPAQKPVVQLELRNKDNISLQVKLEGSHLPGAILSFGCATQEHAGNQRYGLKIPYVRQGNLIIDGYLMTIRKLYTDEFCGQCWLPADIIQQARIIWITANHISIINQFNKYMGRFHLEK